MNDRDLNLNNLKTINIIKIPEKINGKSNPEYYKQPHIKKQNKFNYQINRKLRLKQVKIYASNHKKEIKEYKKNWHLKNKKQHNEKNKKNYQENREHYLNLANNYNKENREKILPLKREYSDKYYGKLRVKLLNLFENKCNNPYNIDHSDFEKEIDYIRCLQLDHINGGGCKENKKFHRLTLKYYNYICSNLKYYQLLCPTCNWLKRFKNKEIKYILLN